MNSRKKLLVAAGALVGALLLALLVLPLLFRDRIAARARAEIDEAVDARVDWSGIGLTFFRDFPNLTLGLRDLTVVGVDAFEADTLVAMRSLRFVLDVGSVLGALRERGPIVVRSIRLERPALHLKVLEDGTANWDVVRRAPEEEATEEGPPRALDVELRSFEIDDGRVVLENERSGLFASLGGLRHTLGGNLSRERVVVRTRTHADSATVRFAGTPWLSGVTVDFQAAVDANLAEQRFTFEDNELRLNELALRFSGEVARADDAMALDLGFAAPSTEFGEILSLVPALYEQDFASLETSGSFSLDGRVQGTYGEDAFPELALTAEVEDGMFRYPDLPLPARDISLALSVRNPGGDPDLTVVRLERLHVVIGDQPLDAALTLRTPISDPDVDARVEGTLDLAALASTVKLEGVEELGGVVTADATVRARRSDLDSMRYDRVTANGSVAMRDVTLAAADLRQPVAVEEASLALSPQRADLRSFRARLGSSDLQAEGWIDNLLGYALRDQALHGSATFSSSRFVLDEWRSEDPELEVIPVPASLDLELEGTVDTLMYGALEMHDARGSLNVRDERLTLEDFTLETLGGRVGLTGHYETVDPTRPTFAMDLAIDSLDVAGAAETFVTVRALAPVARYARGSFSADLDLNGAMNRDFTPVLDVLDGAGSVLTSRIAIEGFPLLQRLSERLSIPPLSSPTLEAIRSTVEIREGRLHVQPFGVSVGDFRMMVAGSNGIDQSLDYALTLALPRGVLGEAADRFVQGLAERAGQVGLGLQAADSVRLGVRVGGTVSDPTLDIGLGEAATSVQEQAEGAAEAAVERRVEEAREQLDSTREEARRRAQAQADSIVAEAERRAETIRAEARELAEEVRAEGNRRADEVLARATNPIARRAAEPVADRIRREAEERAVQIEREADERAEALVEQARQRAEALVRDSIGGG